MTRKSILRLSLLLILVALTVQFKAAGAATEDCDPGDSCAFCLCQCDQQLDACRAAGFTPIYCSGPYRACTADCRASVCDPEGPPPIDP